MSAVRQRKGPKKSIKEDEISSQTEEALQTQNRGILKFVLFSAAIITSVLVFVYLFPTNKTNVHPEFAKPPKSATPIADDDPLPSLLSAPSYIPKPSFATPYQVLGEIPKIRWRPDLSFASEVAARGLPVVLTNTFVTEWQAITWTPQYIADRLQDHELKNVYKHNKNLFGPYWSSERPMAKIPTIKRQNPWEESSYEFLYYAGNINTIGDLAADLEPVWPLELDPESNKQNINVWVGQGNTIADTHYDAYENFNVQLFGKKKWTVFEPNAPLYLYPHTHPSNAQCQVVISNADLNIYPLLSQCKAYEVIMEPGDVLYLPPMWFHQVEALETSISVNAWSFSNQTNLLRDFANMPNGISYILTKKGSSWNNPNKQAVLKFWLEKLIESVNGPDSSAMFIRHLLDQRFEPLYRKGELLREVPSYCGYHSDNRKAIKEVKSLLNSSVEKLAEIIKTFPKNVHDVWLGNIAETIAFIGSEKSDARYVGDFLQQCFFGGDFNAEE